MTASPAVSAPVVLVVDDNDANRALAQSTLEDEGFCVILAPGGAEGIAAFEAHHPDCVLLDVRMPNIDGFAACERIRAAPGGADVPIVFLTAQRDVDTFDRALLVGGDDFLTKPFRPNELVMRVQAALKLRRLRTELSEHYLLLRKQRDDLLRLQLQKERLTAFVVHDLKNPVNSMDLHAQVLLRAPDLPPAAREGAAQIRRDARQLTRMILNLLDLSKNDEGKLVVKRSTVDLTALVNTVFGELGAAADARQVRLESALGTTVASADEDLLGRMLTNLVENAIRHAPPRSAVIVSTRAEEQGTLMRISDEGRGVPSELATKIFDPFVQVEGTVQVETRTGRGLGLAFCRVAAEAHGGRIWVEAAAPANVSPQGPGGPSEKGPGAAFCVFLKEG